MQCRQPDRDAPKLTCGYPLPCPYHTAVLDGDRLTLPPRLPDPARTIPALRKVRKALQESRTTGRRHAR